MSLPNTTPAISMNQVGKAYLIYDKPQDRLKQMLWRGRKQYYREFWALRELSLEVAQGETIGIVGRNGSGKSTLLKLLCGTLEASTGEVRVHGRIAPLLELGAGFNPEFTGRENVFLNASILGLDDETITERFDAILAFADIGEFIEQPVKHYSSGMFLRLAFAVIAHVDADILVVDEALAVGDVFFVQKCMRFLREFRERGTLVFVSHDTGTVINLCDRAVWLDHGRMRRHGPAKTVCEYYLNADQKAALPAAPAKQPEPPAKERSGAEQEEYDQRLNFVNCTSLRNDIEVVPFTPRDLDFGDSGAAVTDVWLEDTRRQALSWVVGGETVTLILRAQANHTLFQPSLGFFLKDRLGQHLFGENTFLSTIDEALELHPGQVATARFTFAMPILPVGDYSFDVAVASGTEQQHVIRAWYYDAYTLKSHATSNPHGLLGLPMRQVSLEIEG